MLLLECKPGRADLDRALRKCFVWRTRQNDHHGLAGQPTELGAHLKTVSGVAVDVKEDQIRPSCHRRRQDLAQR